MNQKGLMNNQAFFFAAKPDKVKKNFKGAFLIWICTAKKWF